MNDWLVYPDLASRRLGASVVAANDESFAQRENLIRPEPAVFDPAAFGPKGKIYDGWETRRRREAGFDHAIVRLAAPTVVRGIIVDTSHFLGNYPPEVSIEGARVDGFPSPNDLELAEWTPLVERSPVQGGHDNAFDVRNERRWTHVRLCLYPDGGVARLRIHGEVVSNPWIVSALGIMDLAALLEGARVIGCSDAFYGATASLLAPGMTRSMGEGWETARRRDEGNDWALIRLAAPGHVLVAELDTSWYLHNSPGEASLTGVGAPSDEPVELLPRRRLQPDLRHRFVVDAAPPVTQVRLDIFPDGGMARLRLWGRPSTEGIAFLHRRFEETA